MVKKKPNRFFHNAMRVALSGLMVFACVTTAIALVDYGSFVDQIRDQKTFEVAENDLPSADAVVVLTGGANRISAAVELLKANHGRRLLISGVSESTSRADLGRVLSNGAMLYGCCIDIDRQALDTRGNAVHAADWVALHDFQKILLVTSSYHMPRSLMLVEAQMPDVDVVAVPIQPPNWETYGFLRLVFSPIMFREYAKYRIAAFGIEPSVLRITSAFLTDGQGLQS